MINTIFYILIIAFSFLLSYFILKLLSLKITFIPEDREEVKEVLTKKRFISCGGIGIICSTILTYCLFNYNNLLKSKSFTILFTLSFFFIIGLIDDLIKIKGKDKNGLSAMLRLFLELVGTIIICYLININNFKFIEIKALNISLSLGIFTIFYAFLCICGFSNAFNFTDGIDGLSTGLLIISLTPFFIFAFNDHNEEIIILILALYGSLFSFLTYNFPPSKIIMGDCGSLPLGAIYALIGLLLNKELLLLISGGIFLLELLSVILQVGYFKITNGKRIFKMAPVHYHFIKKGKNETQVVLLFMFFNLLLAIITSILGGIR